MLSIKFEFIDLIKNFDGVRPRVISYSNEIHIDCLIATDFSNFDIHYVLIIVIANSQPRYQLMYALSFASPLIAIQFLFGILLSVSVLGESANKEPKANGINEAC